MSARSSLGRESRRLGGLAAQSAAGARAGVGPQLTSSALPPLTLPPSPSLPGRSGQVPPLSAALPCRPRLLPLPGTNCGLGRLGPLQRRGDPGSSAASRSRSGSGVRRGRGDVSAGGVHAEHAHEHAHEHAPGYARRSWGSRARLQARHRPLWGAGGAALGRHRLGKWSFLT